jgi:hypothetical protein
MKQWHPSPGLLAAAAGIVLGAALAWWWVPDVANPTVAGVAPATVSTEPRSTTAAPSPPASDVTSTAPAVSPTSRPLLAPTVAPAAVPDEDPTPDLSAYVTPGERPAMGEVIQRLRSAGVEGGLAAFPPPGTRPALIGLAVPEDFVLPEGYVRHHQVTDDGQRIEAILMFAPDRQVVEVAGRTARVPENRVVPPELAPPGLPLRQIVLPPPADTARPGS